MLHGRPALKRLIELLPQFDEERTQPLFDTLEQDLKQGELAQANLDMYIYKYKLLQQEKEQLKQVLDIIVKKEVNMTAIKSVDTLEKYNNTLLNVHTKTSAKKRYLTKDEFKLIKNYLESEN